LQGLPLKNGFSVAWSPDGKTLAGGSWLGAGGKFTGTGQLVFWKWRGRERLTVPIERHPEVRDVEFSPDGRWLAVAAGLMTSTQPEHLSGEILLWDVKRRRLQLTLMFFPPRGTAGGEGDWLAFTPDGFYDASRGGEERIRWQVGKEVHEPARFRPEFRRPDKLLSSP